MYRHKKQAEIGWWPTRRYSFLYKIILRYWHITEYNQYTHSSICYRVQAMNNFCFKFNIFHGFLHKCPRVNKLNVILRSHCWGQYNARAIAVAIVVLVAFVIFTVLSIMIMAAAKGYHLLFQHKLWQMIINNLMILSIIYSPAFSVYVFNLFTPWNSYQTINFVK